MSWYLWSASTKEFKFWNTSYYPTSAGWKRQMSYRRKLPAGIIDNWRVYVDELTDKGWKNILTEDSPALQKD